jgi:hypothetical protein
MNFSYLELGFAWICHFFFQLFLATQHGYCHHEHLKNGTFININTTWDLAKLGIFTAQVASSSLFNGKSMSDADTCWCTWT